MNFERAFHQLYKSYLRTIAAVEMRKETLEGIVDGFSDFLLLCYPDGAIIRGNSAASALFGRPPADMGGKHFFEIFNGAERVFVQSLLEKVSETGNTLSEMIEVVPKLSKKRLFIYWTVQRKTLGGSEDPEILVILGKDQTDLLNAQNQISYLLSCIPVGLLTINLDGEVLQPISDYARKLLNISLKDAASGDTLVRLFPEVDVRQRFLSLIKKMGQPNCDVYRTIQMLPKESRIIDSSGDLTWVSLAYHPVPGNNDTGHVVLVVQNTTNMKKAEQEIHRVNNLARTDALTGIKNRSALNEDLLVAFGQLSDPQVASNGLAVLMIDVDHFKQYNDSLGHLEGDKCLQRIAQVLSELSTDPESTPYRYGGEEFCFILANAHVAKAIKIAKAIRDRLEFLSIPHPKSTVGQIVTVSIGIAAIHHDEVAGIEATDILHAADRALYAAKHAGRNRSSLAEVEPSRPSSRTA